MHVFFDGSKYFGAVDGAGDPFIQPVLTAQSGAGANTAQSNYVNTNNRFWRCFDQNGGFWWCQATSGSIEVYGQIQFPYPVRVTKVEISAPTGSGVNAAYVASSITLKASATGAGYQTIGTFAKTGDNAWSCELPQNAVYYPNYRISLFTNAGQCQIGQIKITGYLTDLSYKGVING